MMKLLLNYAVYLQEARRLFQQPEIADPETIDVRSTLHCYSLNRVLLFMVYKRSFLS
jgi:hypothetical protein